jgi:hypothetical protein
MRRILNYFQLRSSGVFHLKSNSKKQHLQPSPILKADLSLLTGQKRAYQQSGNLQSLLRVLVFTSMNASVAHC